MNTRTLVKMFCKDDVKDHGDDDVVSVMIIAMMITAWTVSYTHLDVYKRQG